MRSIEGMFWSKDRGVSLVRSRGRFLVGKKHELTTNEGKELSRLEKVVRLHRHRRFDHWPLDRQINQLIHVILSHR